MTSWQMPWQRDFDTCVGEITWSHKKAPSLLFCSYLLVITNQGPMRTTAVSSKGCTPMTYDLPLGSTSWRPQHLSSLLWRKSKLLPPPTSEPQGYTPCLNHVRHIFFNFYNYFDFVVILVSLYQFPYTVILSQFQDWVWTQSFKHRQQDTHLSPNVYFSSGIYVSGFLILMSNK